MNISNQKPIVLSPVYNAKITGDYELSDLLDKNISEPIINSALMQGQPVRITDKGNVVNTDIITEQIINCCGDFIDQPAEDWTKELFSKTLVYYDKTTKMLIQNLYSIQAAKKENLPCPDSRTIYVPANDIIPVAKEFLAGLCTHDKFFVGLAFYAKPEILGYSFINESAFDAFKAWLANEISMIATNLSSDTNNMFNDFQQLTLDRLTESISVRNDRTENNEELSFARVLVSYLNRYVNMTNDEVNILPFNLNELYCPKNLVFVNIEKHSRATSKEIADEWDIINKSLQMNIKVASYKKLKKLTSCMRNIKKTAAAAAAAAQQGTPTARSASAPFRDKPLTTVDMVRLVSRIVNRMKNVAMSSNSYKCVKTTFSRPSRRDQNDYNRQGRSVSMKYKPDIHVYLDTSGSISEENYRDAITALIKMAMKLNVDFKFNTFSDYMTEATTLNLKNKTAKQCYIQFQKVPKASGGTNYEQIWHYINRYPSRKRELSLLITDFEYYPPNKNINHPKNLYYIPISNTDWRYIKSSAESFCKSMQNIEPNIRKHILF